MWVSSMTSARHGGGGGGSVSSGGHNNHRATTNVRDVPAAFTWNVLLRVCTAIVLLNTIGLITLVCADTVQYPVTAPFGSVIPSGKRQIALFFFASASSLCLFDQTTAGALSRSFNKLKQSNEHILT